MSRSETTVSTSTPPIHAGGRFHLDRRAADLIAKGQTLSPDALLRTPDQARWLGVSTQWLEIGRSRGYGPPFIRLSARRCVYKVSSTLEWLRQREFTRTSEYSQIPAKAAESSDA